MYRVGRQCSIEGLREYARASSIARLRAGAYAFVRVVKKAGAGRCWYAVAVTLTYRDMGAFASSRGRSGKRGGLSRYLDAVGHWLKRHGVGLVAYGWVLELQGRGVPHYHVLLVIDRPIRMPKPDAWVWEYGSSSIQSLGRVEGLSVSYLAKYLQKPTQKGYAEVPELIGVRKFGWVIRLDEWREVFRWLRLPWYVRKFAYFFQELPRRVAYAGWWFRSAEYLIMTDGRVLRHAGGYFTFMQVSNIGVLEGVDEGTVKEVAADSWDRLAYSGAWYPATVGVEAAVEGNGGVGWGDVVTSEVFIIP